MRARLALAMATMLVAACACVPVAQARVGGFESGDFREFSWWSASNGSLEVTDARAYEGSRSARASNGGIGNQYQRVWHDVAWGEGSDVWYGMALLVPRLADWCWWEPVRWDNYKSFGGAGDLGGVRIERGELFLDRGTYAAQEPVIGPVAVPEGRWFWLEVHQRFSATAGAALSEVFLDGVRVGVSGEPNSAGRAIDTIRFGNVAMEAGCSVPSSVYFDRVSITDHPLGPLEAGAPAPGDPAGSAPGPPAGPVSGAGGGLSGEGRPVGEPALALRCRRVTGASRRRRCTVARPARALARLLGRRTARVTLRRRNLVRATGTAARSRRGVVLRLVARKPLRRGRYSLALRIGKTVGRWPVTLR